jgi:uncharacterized membrane protein
MYIEVQYLIWAVIALVALIGVKVIVDIVLAVRRGG